MRDIKLALRTIKNYPLYTIVNIVGLALSLACTIVLARYIYSETTVDSNHPKADRICTTYIESQSGWDSNFARIHKNDLPLLSDAVLLNRSDVIVEKSQIVVDGTTQPYDAISWRIDSVFEQLFDFEVISGDKHLCRAKEQAAITADFATKLFGADNPIGKRIVVKNTPLTISAVINTNRHKSSFKFDILLHYKYKEGYNGQTLSFIELAPGHTADYMNAKYDHYVQVFDNSSLSRYQLLPLKDIYMHSPCKSDNFEHGNARAVNIMFIVMLAVLVVGIFNFVNIYTVMMLRRSRELGLKGIFGAPTAAIARGLYVEHLVLVALSVIAGWILANAAEPLVVGSLGIVAVQNLKFDLMLSAAIVVCLPVLTAAYPYLKYRYQKPISTIQNINSVKGGSITRSIFLVAQYVITVVIVVVSIFFMRQLDFMLSADLGYKHDGIVKLRMFEEPSWLDKEACQAYGKQMEGRAQIVEADMASSGLFTRWGYCISPNDNSFTFSMDFTVNGITKKIDLSGCTSSFFDMFSIPITWGRGWSDSLDKWNGYKMIVNEAFLRQFNITDPATTIVQPAERLWTFSDGTPEVEAEMETNPPYSIVGVCADFQSNHLSSGMTPRIITCDNNFWGDGAQGYVGSDFCAQIVEGKEREAIAMLEKLYAKVGGLNFKYSMVNDEVTAQYAEDKRLTLIFSTFAIIAIIISSMGLFSLSLYDIGRRTKEIALRRVNGAMVNEIVVMLLRKYYLLLGLSFVIATPAAAWAINWYLADFAVRTPLSWWIFAIAMVVTAIISLTTLIFQIRKAAATNPTHYL